MTVFLHIHPENPQERLIDQAIEIIRDGGVIVYPTDAGYALGCHLNDKDALDRIRQLRQLSPKHFFTLVCYDLSEIAIYAKVDNQAYRQLKAHTPGPYTFVLNATGEVPRRLVHPKRKTIGIRVPDCRVTLELLAHLKEPLLSTSLILPYGEPLYDPEIIYDVLKDQVELIIDGGYLGIENTSIIDFTQDIPQVIREGKGDVSDFL